MRHSGTEYGYLTSGELVLTLGFDEYRMKRRRLGLLRLDHAARLPQRVRPSPRSGSGSFSKIS